MVYQLRMTMEFGADFMSTFVFCVHVKKDGITGVQVIIGGLLQSGPQVSYFSLLFDENS